MKKIITAIFGRRKKIEYKKLSFDEYYKDHVTSNCIYYYAVSYKYNYSMCIIYFKGREDSVIQSSKNPITWTVSQNCIENAINKNVISSKEFKNAYYTALEYLNNVTIQF